MRKAILLLIVFLVLSSSFASAWWSDRDDYVYKRHVYKNHRERYDESYGRDYTWTKVRYSRDYGIRYSREWKDYPLSNNYKNRLYGHKYTPRKYTNSWYKSKDYLHCYFEDWEYHCEKEKGW